MAPDYIDVAFTPTGRLPAQQPGSSGINSSAASDQRVGPVKPNQGLGVCDGSVVAPIEGLVERQPMDLDHLVLSVVAFLRLQPPGQIEINDLGKDPRGAVQGAQIRPVGWPTPRPLRLAPGRRWSAAPRPDRSCPPATPTASRLPRGETGAADTPVPVGPGRRPRRHRGDGLSPAPPADRWAAPLSRWPHR